MSDMNLCFHPETLSECAKPVPPGKNTIAYILASVFLIVMFITSWAEIEVVTRAEGKTIPSSQVKILRSSYTGLVSDIQASDGLEVKAGDLLISFDTRELLGQRAELRVLG